MSKKIVFASDHAGFELKKILLSYVSLECGIDTEDCGAHAIDPDDDYPEIIALAAKRVSEDPENTRAIILGGSGQGEAMVANRFPNVRAAVYYGHDALSLITLSRQHNDANVLSIGARFVTAEEAKTAVRLWLETPFSNEERHARRIKKIEEIR